MVFVQMLFCHHQKMRDEMWWVNFTVIFPTCSNCVCVCLVGIVIPFNSACVWFSFGRCWCWNSFVVSFALGRKAWMEHSTHNTDLRVILKLVDFFNKWTVFVMECGFVNFPNHHFDVQVFGCLKSFEPKHNLYNFLIWNLYMSSGVS